MAGEAVVTIFISLCNPNAIDRNCKQIVPSPPHTHTSEKIDKKVPLQPAFVCASDFLRVCRLKSIGDAQIAQAGEQPISEQRIAHINA